MDNLTKRLSDLLQLPQFQAAEQQKKTPDRSKIDRSEIKDELHRFETFHDDELIRMVDEARRFIRDVHCGDERFLTFTGQTGIGKSFCISLIKDSLKSVRFKSEKNSRSFGAPRIIHKDWSLLFDELNSKFSETIWKLKNCGLLIIEEFVNKPVSKHTGWTDLEVEKAKDVLNCRAGKATILETNKSPEEIHNYDQRIYSRLTRDFNCNKLFGTIVHLKNVPEYQDRKREEQDSIMW
jgi:DNA replication protein DnaC